MEVCFVSRYVGAAEEGFSAELSALCKTNECSDKRGAFFGFRRSASPGLLCIDSSGGYGLS